MAAGLEEPGWPSLPDQGAVLVSAMQAGGQLSRQRQQLEMQLERMAIQQNQMQWNMDLKEREFQQKIAQNDALNQYREMRLDLSDRARDAADRRADLAYKVADWKIGEKEKAISDTSDFADYIVSTGLKPGDAEYPSAWMAGKK